MKFGLNDVFDSLETALDMKKIGFELAGLLAAILGYLLISWLGTLFNNVLIYSVLQILALLYFYLIAVVLAGAMSHMCYKQLTSGEKITAGQALSFATKNIWALILSPAALGITAAIVLGIEYLVFLLAKIPYMPVVFSLLTVPVILLNASLMLFLALGLLLVSGMIAVDSSGTLKTVNGIINAVKKAPLQILMSLALIVVIGAPILATLVFTLAGATIMTLSLFGSASGVFMEMASTEVPTLSAPMYIAWGTFVFFVFTAVLSVAAFKLVYIKSAMVAVYLKIKDQLK